MTAGETYQQPPSGESGAASHEADVREAVAETLAQEAALGAREAEPVEGAITAKVAGGSLLQSAGKLFGYASAFVVLALTARLLTISGFGDYTIAIVYLQFVNVIADLGISIIAVREASREPERLEAIYHTALTLKTLAAAVVYGLSFALVFLMPYSAEARLGVIIMGISFLIASVGQAFDILYQTRLEMAVPTYGDILSKIATMLGVVALYFLNQRYGLADDVLFYSVVAIVSASNLVGFVSRWWGARRILPLRFGLDRALGAYLLRMAIPMGVVTILGQIHYKADAVILSLLRPTTDVAIYGVAYRMIDFMVLFFTVFVNMVFPVLSGYSGVGGQRYQQALERVLNACFMLAVPATAGVILLAPEIVAIAGGDRYPNAALPMRILSLAVILTGLAMIYNYVIIVQNRQRSLVWITLILVVANVGLNVYFVPIYSYLASAIITDVTTGLGLALAIVVAVRRQRVAPSWLALLKIASATLAMLAVIQTLRLFLLREMSIPGTLLMICVGGAIYGIVLYLLGGVDQGLLLVARRKLASITGRRG